VARALALAALIVALTAAVVLVFVGGERVELRARFLDAGQLVTGDEVQVGGRSIGTVTAIELADDGQAELTLALDKDAAHLRRGTTAAIRAPGSSGVANRYVELVPGPRSAPLLPAGSTLPTTQTQGIVDIDQLLDDLDPATRARLRSVLVQASRAVRGTGAAVNDALRHVDPAVQRSTALLDEVVRDRRGLSELLRSGASVATELRTHATDVQAAADDGATTLAAVADGRRALAGTLRRAPAVLRQATGTFGRTDAALRAITPALTALRPAAAPLAQLLDAVAAIGPRAEPTLRALARQLGPLRSALRGVPALAGRGVPALEQTRTAIVDLLPVATGLRPYAGEFVNGFFQGLGGAAGHNYDANGHYIRVNFLNGGGGTEGLLSLLPQPADLAGLSYRTGVTRRCPGGATQPAADGSSPVVDAAHCDREDTAP
jgi:phospholipid/cholesterol/gamma-HCH transport system substrate-binding protein